MLMIKIYRFYSAKVNGLPLNWSLAMSKKYTNSKARGMGKPHTSCFLDAKFRPTDAVT